MNNRPVALVTGASKNIGIAIAKRFAKEGYDVCITSTKQETADASCAEIQKLYPDITAKGYQMFSNDTDSIDRAFAQLRRDFGRIDALVANAADPGYNQSILNTTPEQFDYVMNTNARGYFFCSQHAAKLMIEKGIRGSIVLIGSVHSKAAIPNRIVYASSKGAIDTMNRNMCYELGKFGIRSNVIVVGAVCNDRWACYTEEDYAKKRANWPLGMESYPEDIASAAFFLSSDQAKTVSGTELTVDSGVMSVLLSYNKNWDAELDEREKFMKK